jgi:hypothetical protein
MRHLTQLLGSVGALVATAVSGSAAPLTPRQPAAVFVVANANDSGPGSLRQAILDANALAGPDTIAFALSGTVPSTIVVGLDLPAVTDPVTIDATTQAGYTGSPVVELRGGGEAAIGLDIAGGHSVVRGLSIDGFATGVRLRDKPANVVDGCNVGTDSTGIEGIGNELAGIEVIRSSASRIGGVAPGAGNVISRNGHGVVVEGSPGTVIQGNFVGTDRTGDAHLGNRHDGIHTASRPTMVGGVEPGAGNVIAFNGGAGVATASAAVLVLSNSIYENRADGIHFEGPTILLPPTVTFVGPAPGGTQVSGAIFRHVYAGDPIRVEIFRSSGCGAGGAGQGKDLVGASDGRFDAAGLFAFSTVVPIALEPDESIVVTATLGSVTTTAFSECRGDTEACTLPFITRTQGEVNLPVGQTVTLEAEATGTGPLAYQWYRTGATGQELIAGATAPRLFVPPVTERLVTFYVDVTGSCGSARDSVRVSTCNGAPVIDMQSQGATVPRGTVPQLFVTLASTDRAFYQWYEGQSGDTSKPLESSADNYIGPPLTGTTSYWVRVQNACGTVDSNTMTFTVPAPIEITKIRIKRDGTGASKIVAKGRNVTSDVRVLVDAFLLDDYVRFEGEAKVKGSTITQRGGLVGGRTIDELIAPGRTVRMLFVSSERGGTVVEYTRP